MIGDEFVKYQKGAEVIPVFYDGDIQHVWSVSWLYKNSGGLGESEGMYVRVIVYVNVESYSCVVGDCTVPCVQETPEEVEGAFSIEV